MTIVLNDVISTTNLNQEAKPFISRVTVSVGKPSACTATVQIKLFVHRDLCLAFSISCV